MSDYNFRRKLGIVKRRRKVRRLKPDSRALTPSQVSLEALLAARKILAEVGDQETAIAAVMLMHQHPRVPCDPCEHPRL